MKKIGILAIVVLAYAAGYFTHSCDDVPVETNTMATKSPESSVKPETKPEVDEPASTQPGKLQVFTVMSDGGPKVGGSWFKIFQETKDDFGKLVRVEVASNGYGAEKTFDLNPGTYIASATLGSARAEKSVTVKGQSLTTCQLNYQGGRLTVSSVMAEGQDPSGGSWFNIYRDDTDSFGETTQVKVTGDGYKSTASFVLPEGEYVARATFGAASAQKPFTINAGQGTKLTLNLKAGRLQVSSFSRADKSKIEGTWFNVYREATDAFGKLINEKVTGDGYKHSTSFILPAGTYTVHASQGQQKGRATVTVKAGEHTDEGVFLE